MANRPPPPRTGSRAWYLLLLLPFIGLLWPPFYAKEHPRLAGFPFFYWYQFLWVLLGAGNIALVYLLTTPPRARPAPRPPRRPPPGGGGAARHEYGRPQRLRLLLPAGHRARLHRRPVAPGRPRPPQRVGPRRPQLRHGHHLVPARRGPVHRLHLYRRPGAGVRSRRPGLLRPALHDHRLPVRVPGDAAAVVGGPQAPVRHPCRLRAWPLR